MSLQQPIICTFAQCFSALNVLPRPPFPHSPALCSSARPLLAWQSSRGKGGRTDQPIERPWAPSRPPSTCRACGAERKRGREREKRRARLSAFTSAEKLQRHLHAKAASETQAEVNQSSHSNSKSCEQEVAVLSSERQQGSESSLRFEFYDHDYDTQVRRSYFQQESGRAARA